MAPAWLTLVAWCAIALGGGCAAWIAVDIILRGHRQQMPVMGVVWPITALYLGPAAVWGYRRFGLPQSPAWREEHGLDEPPPRPEWASVAVGVSHCGGGCTLGDLIGAWLVFALALKMAGLALYAEFVVDYLLALALGITFQYFAIAPMRDLRLSDGLVQAAKADVLSLSAFEIGMFGWMALTQLVFFRHPHLTPDHAAYWLMMQVGMVLGFLTAWPVNAWLIRQGIKERM